MEKAQQEPEQGISICQKISAAQREDDCLLLLMEQYLRTSITQTEALCQALTEPANHDECYFRLAEYSKKKRFCSQAGRFQTDCSLHLFSRELFRSKASSYQTVEALAADFDIEPSSIEGETVIYRHLLSLETPLPILKCQDLPNPDACQRAAQGLYLDRLRYAHSHNQFPCQELGDLDHSNTPILLHEYQKMAQEECP